MQTENEILISILFGVAAMLIMALAIVIFVIQYHKRGISNKLEIEKLKTKQQEELLNTISNAQEAERRRISANLHDEVGSSLSAINIMIDEASMYTEGRAKDLITSADENLQKTMLEIRNIIQDMSPVIVEKSSLYAAIKEICSRLNKTKKLSIYFDAKVDNPIKNKTVELKLYRIVQELVNNVIKHANANVINIVVSKTEKYFVISIHDNGIGIDLEKAAKSNNLGLENIRAQLEFMKGKFELKNLYEGGTNAIVFVPLEKTLDL